MKKTFVGGLTLACLVVLATQAQAYYPCYYDCCPTCVTYVDKVVVCYKPVWKEEKIKCVINRVHCRVVEVPMACKIWVPKWVDVKRDCVYYVDVPHHVIRDVVRCHYVPVEYTDPCSCCTYVCYHPHTYIEKVKCTVWHCEKRVKPILVKHCIWEPREHKYVVHRHIYECRPETVFHVRRYCVPMPYHVTVRVPVCVPCYHGHYSGYMPPVE